MASYNDACCVVSSLCIFASLVETVSQMEKNIRMILHMLSVKVHRQIKLSQWHANAYMFLLFCLWCTAHVDPSLSTYIKRS